MQELIRTRCTQGWLVITDDYIRIELGNLRQQTLYRSSLVGVDSQRGAPSFFGKGGGVNIIFRGQGLDVLKADLVKPSVAQEIVGMLQHPPA